MLEARITILSFVWSKPVIVTGPSSPEMVLEANVASKTKFSASLWPVKSVVPSSIFDPDPRPDDEDTEPDKILILSEDKSASTIPFILIDPEAPEESGAKDIKV